MLGPDDARSTHLQRHPAQNELADNKRAEAHAMEYLGISRYGGDKLVERWQDSTVHGCPAVPRSKHTLRIPVIEVLMLQ
jgi:hypothetical protein